LKISKNTLLLGGAVGLGVLCFLGAQYYLRTTLSDAQAKLAGSYKTRQVIVAAVDIPAGGVLSTDNLATRTIPDRYLASTALGPDSVDAVSGQKIVVGVKAGDPIDRGALERADRAALSTTVAKGERAITFPVDEISSISGMLVPGDIIDLLFTGPGNTVNSYGPQPNAAGTSGLNGPKELLHVRPILQAVQVMATGKTTQKRVIKNEAGAAQEVNMDFTTVTLKVNPAQAESVLMGQKLGQLTAVLRNPDDKGALSNMILDETSFKQVANAPPAGVGKYVEMYVGGFGSGAVRSRSEQGPPSPAPISVRLEGISPTRASAEKPAPSALDVRNRLGIAAPPAKSSNSSFPLTR
jgi:pilus assembly protein CpaB